MARVIHVDTTVAVGLNDIDDEDIRDAAEERNLVVGGVAIADLLDALIDQDAPQWIIDGLNDWLTQPRPKSSLSVAFARHKRW